MKTCTVNLQEQLENKYNDITHVNIAEMLAKDGYLNDTDTIQISTCHRYVSVCFDTRDILLKFTSTEHSALNYSIIFTPDSNINRKPTNRIAG